MKRAMFIKTVSDNVLLYKLSDPVKFDDEETFDVVVSAIDTSMGCRATIFPSDDCGNIVSFKEIDQVIGTLDHEAPLTKLGYQIM